MNSNRTNFDLILLVGAPTSGKTTWCRNHPHYSVISRDDIRTSINGKYHKFDPNNEGKVSEIFENQLETVFTKRIPVIIDNCNNRAQYIYNIVNKAPIDYNIGIKYFETSKYKFWFRNIIRFITKGKWIPFQVYSNMFRQCYFVYHRILPQYLKTNRHLKITLCD